jgi:predicted O-linked N-acetylglucosamine transferase (SPINDLY family)
MAPFLPLAAHIARLSLADLVLDSLPYNAHTTAADALWAGVPVITQIGTTFPGRVGASILGAINLPELVTNTQADFESTAIRLAMNKPLLQSLRQKLADNRTTAPLFNTASFTKHIETAYQTMFENSGIGNVHQAPNFMG